jgi:hypothetical protein
MAARDAPGPRWAVAAPNSLVFVTYRDLVPCRTRAYSMRALTLQAPVGDFESRQIDHRSSTLSHNPQSGVKRLTAFRSRGGHCSSSAEG